jgi:hypothetical protein
MAAATAGAVFFALGLLVLYLKADAARQAEIAARQVAQQQLRSLVNSQQVAAQVISGQTDLTSKVQNLLADIINARDPNTRALLIQSLAQLPVSIPESEIKSLADTLLAQLASSQVADVATAAQAFIWLAPKLPQSIAAKAITTLINRMSTTSDPIALAKIAQAVIAVAGQFREDQLQSWIAQLKDVSVGAPSANSRSWATDVVNILAPSTSPRETTYLVCIGEYPNRCGAGTKFLPCGSDAKTWARSQPNCGNPNIRILSDISGNQCGCATILVTCPP